MCTGLVRKWPEVRAALAEPLRAGTLASWSLHTPVPHTAHIGLPTRPMHGPMPHPPGLLTKPLLSFSLVRPLNTLALRPRHGPGGA